MTAADLIAALQLPPSARVDRRVPKSLLTEHGAPTAADKRLLLAGIEELRWVATCKPNTVAVPEFHDGERDYLEVAVVAVTLRVGARVARVVELVHRAIPHPVLLVCDGVGTRISVAHKRKALKTAEKVVLDGAVVEVELGAGAPAEVDAGFAAALAMARQPRASIYELVQGWVDVLVAYQAALRTGVFGMRNSREGADARLEALRQCERLEAEATRLRGLGKNERQLARMVEINLGLQRVRAELSAVTKLL